MAPATGLGPELQFDARALQLVEHGAERLRLAEPEGELGQLGALKRLARIVAQAVILPPPFSSTVSDLSTSFISDGFEIEARRFAGVQAVRRARSTRRRACRESPAARADPPRMPTPARMAKQPDRNAWFLDALFSGVVPRYRPKCSKTRDLLAHHFNDDAFRALAVELGVIDLLPGAEVELARR